MNHSFKAFSIAAALILSFASAAAARPRLSGASSGLKLAAVGGSTAPQTQVTPDVGAATGIFSADPGQISFLTTVGGPNPASRTVTVSTSSGSDIAVNASVGWSASSWLSVSPTSGTLRAGAPLTLTVTANTINLGASTYYGAITLTSGSSVQAVSVQLVVSPSGAFVATPNPVYLTAQSGTTTAVTQAVTVTNSTSSNLTVTPSVTAGGGWLTTTGAVTLGAMSTGSITFQAMPSGLSAGDYTGNVALTPSSGAAIQVPVYLTIPAPGNLSLSKSSILLSSTGGLVSDMFRMTNLTGGAIGFNLTVTYQQGLNWLSVNPATGSIGAGSIQDVAVTANPAGLVSGTYNATITVTPASGGGSAQTVAVAFAVGGANAISANPSSLIVSTIAGSAGSGIVRIYSSYSTVTVVPSSAQVYCSNGQYCASISPAADSASLILPAAFTVMSNPALASGTYRATLTFSSGAASVSVPLQINVGSSGGVIASPGTLSLAAPVAGGVQSSSIFVSSGATGYYTATSNQTWLSVGSLNSTVTGLAVPGVLTVYANPASLAEGSYTGQVTISGGGGTQTVSVTFVVGGAGGNLSVAPMSLAFTAAPGSGATAARIVSVYAATTTSYVAAASTQSGGSWLSITPPAGATPAAISVQANAAGLASGTYYGTITISSAIGSQTVFVSLTVGGASDRIVASPTVLDFQGAAGGANPDAQSISVVGYTPLFVQMFYAAASTTSGGNWLSVAPASSVTPRTLTVSVNTAGLPPGTYSGQINITASNLAPATVQVTLTVAQVPILPLAVSPQSLVFNHQQGATPPASQTLTLSSTIGAMLFTATTTATAGGGWLSVNPASGVTPASLSVSVAPGGLAPGEYGGVITITSANAAASPLSVNVRLTVTAAPGPVVAGVLNAGSVTPGALSPGLLVSVFGANLGPAQGVSARIVGGALETAVAETRVLFDDIPAALIYVRADQINAVVPYAVDGKTATRVQVEYRGVRSPALMLPVADAAPGIFTLNNQGTGQAAAINQDGSVNSPGNGAARNSVVVIYATGEGQTSPPGVDGKVTVSAPYPMPVLPVRVTIGGKDADVLYAGAAPGLVAGAMQINARVPGDAPMGDHVPVLVSVGTRSSQDTATLAIQ